MSPRDPGRVYWTGAIYRRNDVEFGVRCDRCGRPIAVSDWEWHADDDSPFVEDIVPPRLCRECARMHEDARSKTGAKLLPGSQCGFGFVAFLIVEKCADSIPIHRIEKRFGRLGIPISRSTMNDLVHTAAEAVRPLVARLQARIAALVVVLADETSMRLQDRPKRGFVWVFHGYDEQSGG